ncbi:protein PTHB1-like [Liolophura sinensis]|uniref:protein PTHB1-like n=1 Tax=Liolophura sinensis TaxID=3198878 RepID=UPI0031598E12
MSLFKARDWWSTTVGEEEEFDYGCMCTANVDNCSSEYDKIIIGSFHGTLRIFSPSPPKAEDKGVSFKPEDVLLESQLNAPILHVGVGKFVSGTEKLHLAILHPRKLSVYSVSAVSGAVQHGSQYQFVLVYEHNLQRTAYSFCFGPFGGVKGKDFICVQSMDGTVALFEQESFAFSRFLPGAVLPGPLKYIPQTDSFVTVSSNRYLECYKYQTLAVSTDGPKEESQSIKSGKRLTCDWAFNIGEQARNIAVITLSQNTPAVLVLGERSILCVTDTGKLKFAKKLDYSATCLCAYAVKENSISYLVGTQTGSVRVYQDTTLKWAATMQHVAVHLEVATFRDLKGVIVSLSDWGRLECSYLGTDPAIFVPPTSESREVNYTDMDKEMIQLQRQIKEKSHKTNVLPSVSSEDDLIVMATTNPELDQPSVASGVEVQDDISIPSISVKIQFKSKILIENIKVVIEVSWPLVMNQSEFSIHSIEPTKSVEKMVSVFQRGNSLPSDLTGHIMAKYKSSSGAPRVTTSTFRLPLKLVVKPVVPVKTAEYKITIDTNKPPANLNDIFPDLLGENAGGPGAALGFQYYGGPLVTLLASKTSQRYRLQCDNFESMWLITTELVNRLTNHFNRGTSQDFKASFSGAIPLMEYFEVVDRHFECRLEAEHCKEMLDQRASQFRAIQRRLLTRFKDKTPAPLANLDTLLDGTYRQIVALGDAIDDKRLEQRRAANLLSCATRLLNLLLKLWLELTDKEMVVLESCLTPVITESEEQGWEESVDSTVTHMLRTVLAKSSKDTTVNPSPMGLPPDTTKLKKHVALLCDRLGKGARLVAGGQGDPLAGKERSRLTRTVEANGNTEEYSEISNPDQYLGKQKKQSKKSKHRELAPLNGPGLPPALEQHNPLSAGFHDLKRQKDIEKLVPDLDDLGPVVDQGGSEDIINGRQNREMLSL